MLSAMWSGIKKEFFLIASQRTALLLVIVFPLIIIVTFGLLYTNTVSQEIPIAVFVDESANQNAADPKSPLYYSIDFYTALEKNSSIRVYRASTPEEVKRIVFENKTDAGIIIEKTGLTQPYTITIVLDRTDFVQSSIIWSTLSSQVNALSNQISTAILEKIWTKIIDQEQDTQRQLGQIEEFQAELEKTSQQTAQIEEALDQFRSEETTQLIQEQRQKISALKQTAITFQQETAYTKAGLLNLKKYFDESLLAHSLATKTPGGEIQYSNPGLMAIGMQLEGYGQQYAASVENQERLNNHLLSELTELDREAETIQQKSQLSTEYLKNLRQFVQKAKSLQNQISQDLTESKALLQEINDTIQGIKQYSPEFLAKPAIPKGEDSIVLPNYATIFFPTILAIVAMFTATLLAAISTIIEKKQGITARFKTMPISKALLVLQKIVGLLLIVLLEVCVLALVGVFFFNIQLYGEILFMLASICLASICFLGIGFLIGTAVHSAPSAVLVTLVVTIPLIFLSGLLLPTELMPNGFQFIKVVNPLSASVGLFTAIWTKGLFFFSSIVEIINLSILALASLAIGYFKYF